MSNQYQHALVEVPFEFRHCCWFCGEPAAKTFSFPQTDNYLLNPTHPALSLFSCGECLIPAHKSKLASIWLVAASVKKYLIKKYHKDLAIGINWTQEELANSEFEQGNFAGFQKSAWLMYEIARERVNFKGWPLIVAGINIDELRWQTDESFIFDGINYPTIEEAIEHYSMTYDLQKSYFKQVLYKLGGNNFAQAVRFCRLLIGTTPDERKQALISLD